jgi:hypothetical protein
MALRRAFLPVLALLCAACASRYDSDDARASEPETIVVDAYNENFYDARVHAVFTGGQRRSLGTVAGNGGRTQTTLAWEPHALVFEISFLISGAEYVSHPLEVSRGEHVELRLPPNIDESGFFRRVSRRSAGAARPLTFARAVTPP